MYKLGNLTIVLPSYRCDKACPFCIAKNNRKFNDSQTEHFTELSRILDEMRNNGIRFERIVLSGNGEPSLYEIETLQELAGVIKVHNDLFDTLRVHTSGNIFWEKDKFDLFNQLVDDVEFDMLRVAIDPKKDMEVLGYSRDYTQSSEFKRAKKIKFDIGLTGNLDRSSCAQDLEGLLHEHPNIDLIRFKNLMSGENEQSAQAAWVRENRMSKAEFMDFANGMLEYYSTRSLNGLKSTNGKRIVLENSGNYPRDVVFSNGIVMDYSERPIDIPTLRRMALTFDNTRTLRYDGIEI